MSRHNPLISVDKFGLVHIPWQQNLNLKLVGWQLHHIVVGDLLKLIQNQASFPRINYS